MVKRYKIGYTQGVYDMFHVGHLNLLNHAKECCDYLIVGVNSDKLVESYKQKIPVINEQNRMKIVANIKAVDETLIVDTLDKEELFQQLHFNAIFIGDDWKDNPRWIQTQEELATHGTDVVFLPYTQDVSSTVLREEHDDRIKEG